MSLLLLLTQPRNVALAASAGSFAVAGADAFAVATPAASASFVITGSATTFAVAVPAAAASYAVTGSGAGFAVTLPAAAAAYSITGTMAGAVAEPAAAGAFTITGAANLSSSATGVSGQVAVGGGGKPRRFYFPPEPLPVPEPADIRLAARAGSYKIKAGSARLVTGVDDNQIRAAAALALAEAEAVRKKRVIDHNNNFLMAA